MKKNNQGLGDNPKRIQRKRSKGWRMPTNTRYVGRPGKLGNPFQVGRQIPVEIVSILDEIDKHNRSISKIYDAAEALRMYRKYFPFPGTPYELTPADLAEIAGKNVACWCKVGDPCHSDFLLEKANPPIEKPDKKKYGWEEPGLYDEGGWMFDGGEERYFEDLLKWSLVTGNEIT